ncbi:MAG: KptA family-domain-containing protein [Monoraphidium minutum]|nr:MAG: KptA family-domain-containing protein [Monoraphidium minutum]
MEAQAPAGMPEAARIKASKQMSKILRHKPPREIDTSGWVPLPVLTALITPPPSEADVRAIVGADSKGRFVLDDSTRPPRIRAAQGHSVQLPAPLLHPVADPSRIPAAVHVTSQEGWRAIQESGELRRMSRTHVHFATAPNHARANAWATASLLLDLRGAMEAGLEFFTSTNGVLLCEGPVPIRFLRPAAEGEVEGLFAAARDGGDGGGEDGGAGCGGDGGAGGSQGGG